jgi:hypothetical protein
MDLKNARARSGEVERRAQFGLELQALHIEAETPLAEKTEVDRRTKSNLVNEMPKHVLLGQQQRQVAVQLASQRGQQRLRSNGRQFANELESLKSQEQRGSSPE